jgi:hypothetical protein
VSLHDVLVSHPNAHEWLKSHLQLWADAVSFAHSHSNGDIYGYSYQHTQAESYCQAKPDSTDASYSTATALDPDSQVISEK